MKKIDYAKFFGGFQPGIYYSNKTGKIFEATPTRGRKVKTRYTCGETGPVIDVGIFRLQHYLLDFYELLIPYEV